MMSRQGPREVSRARQLAGEKVRLSSLARPSQTAKAMPNWWQPPAQETPVGTDAASAPAVRLATPGR
ncbi:hypothetical protein B0T14DRAFT_521435 [Immersiella caudata]|uniref:Uncharacterized protein n=1 Tax=Immersiella caudata TaxID=314043 RepID=A0AA39WRV8_9PEZI|nr:hypothetical protein B0T14DRAFT_521435 [Immersiella caudata]